MSEPVSWLLLERYALGELDASQRADVELRLAASSEDRACLDLILQDRSVLPALPRKKRPLAFAAILSLAAALALTLIPRAVPHRRDVSDGVKGGEVAINVIGEHGRAHHFADGERFKVMLTCPAWLSSRLSVLVFQDQQRFAPLAQVDEFACGNQVPWPGAFALDGAGDVDVCVTWDPELARIAKSARELEPNAVCERLSRRSEGTAQ